MLFDPLDFENKDFGVELIKALALNVLYDLTQDLVSNDKAGEFIELLGDFVNKFSPEDCEYFWRTYKNRPDLFKKRIIAEIIE